MSRPDTVRVHLWRDEWWPVPVPEIVPRSDDSYLPGEAAEIPRRVVDDFVAARTAFVRESRRLIHECGQGEGDWEWIYEMAE